MKDMAGAREEDSGEVTDEDGPLFIWSGEKAKEKKLKFCTHIRFRFVLITITIVNIISRNFSPYRTFRSVVNSNSFRINRRRSMAAGIDKMIRVRSYTTDVRWFR